jgi:hypothetical protein
MKKKEHTDSDDGSDDGSDDDSGSDDGSDSNATTLAACGFFLFPRRVFFTRL